MNKEVAWLFGFLFSTGCLAFYSWPLAVGICLVVILWWTIL